MKKSMKLSVILILVGLFMIAVGLLLVFLVIMEWEVWIVELALTGMIIIIIVSVILIAIGVFIIIKFIT
ncbi:MAG: hypothetical protein HWN81_15075 [Candidatus Lokiarchaeota archaeon]|nr:hypothetical protein [Candidatus Lokiarchaeota archaeon]